MVVTRGQHRSSEPIKDESPAFMVGVTTRKKKRKSECTKRVDEEGKSSSSSSKNLVINTRAQYFGNENYKCHRALSCGQRSVYAKHVRESEGFDVPHFPGVTDYCLIRPSTKNFEHDEGLKMKVRIAIEHFKTNVNQDAKPERAKVLNASYQFCGMCVKYYITFEAIDVADRDQVKTYQALVITGCFNRLEVKFCRLKPTAAPTTPASKRCS